MARKVAAELTLDAKQYLAEAKVVEQRTAAVDREMDQLDRAIDKVDRDAAELAASAAVAARQVDNLGDQAGGTARALTALDARIKATKASMHALGVEAAVSGDAAGEKAFAREKAALARLERLRKTLTPDLRPDKFFDPKNFGGFDFSGFAAESRGFLIASAVGLAVAAAPAISAGIAAAVIGGVGAGGVVGGALLAARDPRVTAAWKGLADGVMAELAPVSDAFVVPLTQSAATFGKAFEASGIVNTLEQAAVLVDPLTVGLAGFVAELGPGLNSIVKQAKPVFDVLKHDLPEFGESLSHGLDQIGDSAGPAAVALHDFFHELDVGIDTTAVVAGGLAKIYPLIRPLTELGVPLFGLAQVWGELTGKAKEGPDFEKLLNDLANIGKVGRESSEGVGVFGEAVSRAEEETKIFNDALSESYSGFLDFTGAEISAEQAIDDLAEGFAKHGTTLDVTTEKGRDNLANLRDLAEAAEEATRKKLAETHSVDDANAVYQHYRDELFEVARQAGLTADQAQILVDKWLALEDLKDIEKFVTITIEGRGSQGVAYLAGDVNPFLKGFAAGGTTPAFEPFRVHKDETIWSSREMFVATAAQSNALGSGGPLIVENHIEVGGEVVRVVRTEITDHDRDTQRRVLAGARR